MNILGDNGRRRKRGLRLPQTSQNSAIILSEGYTHGVQMVIENVRQLRHRADDACPGWAEGKHTYDRNAGCRQLKKADVCCGMAWAQEVMGSCLILRGIAG